MKKFIIIIGTILVLFLWAVPFILYQVTRAGESFLFFAATILISFAWVEYVDNKWNDL